MADQEAGSRTLAKHEGLGSIGLCNCGVVSLNLGGITVRMEIEAFQRLEKMIVEAARELRAEAITLEELLSTAGGAMLH